MTWIKPTDKARVALLQSYPYLKLPARVAGSPTLTKHPNLSSVSSPGEFKKILVSESNWETFQRKPVTTNARNLIPRPTTYIAGREVQMLRPYMLAGPGGEG